ncbi:hypothetical protein [Streptomyces sp. NPDC058398]|uniref:hypothetical protein n=1 Tax=Streptomyces sp. NPDC058398 TaxID=3346479 RepID=UPI003659578B
MSTQSSQVQAFRHPQRWRELGGEQVKVCDAGPNTLVTSRNPDDPKAFRKALIHAFDRAAA